MYKECLNFAGKSYKSRLLHNFNFKKSFLSPIFSYKIRKLVWPSGLFLINEDQLILLYVILYRESWTLVRGSQTNIVLNIMPVLKSGTWFFLLKDIVDLNIWILFYNLKIIWKNNNSRMSLRKVGIIKSLKTTFFCKNSGCKWK